MVAIPCPWLHNAHVGASKVLQTQSIDTLVITLSPLFLLQEACTMSQGLLMSFAMSRVGKASQQGLDSAELSPRSACRRHQVTSLFSSSHYSLWVPPFTPSLKPDDVIPSALNSFISI